MDQARGAYIAFLDSDDTWLPEKLAVQVKLLEESGADVVCCAFLRHADGNIPAERWAPLSELESRVDWHRLLGGNIVSTQTILERASCLRQTRFDTRFPRMQDWDFALRLARDYDLRYDGAILAETFVQPDSISCKPALGLKAIRLLLKKYRHALSGAMQPTQLLLSTAEDYAAMCGKSCAPDYFKALSPRRTSAENIFLLKVGMLRVRDRLREKRSHIAARVARKESS